MRELKILAVVIVLTLITYWGVEPFAHSQMHPHVSPANFNFAAADK
ncbi:cytochrome c1, partial [Aliarcobacter butzleri]